jgi:OOP family OmpA-OmpF porin
MTINKKALIVAALGVAAAAPMLAQAQQAQERGGYLGLSAGRADYKDFCDQTGIAGSCDNADSAWRLFGGFQFNRNLSLELGYANLGAAGAGGPPEARYDVNAWDLVGVATIAMTPQFGLLLKGGLYHADVEVRGTVGPVTGNASDKNTGLTFGVGAQFLFTRNLGVRLEYQNYSGVGGPGTGEDDVSTVMAGVLWKF